MGLPLYDWLNLYDNWVDWLILYDITIEIRLVIMTIVLSSLLAVLTLFSEFLAFSKQRDISLPDKIKTAELRVHIESVSIFYQNWSRMEQGSFLILRSQISPLGFPRWIWSKFWMFLLKPARVSMVTTCLSTGERNRVPGRVCVWNMVVRDLLTAEIGPIEGRSQKS